MKTTVIYHSADFDGLFCREIARKFLPDAELIGWDFIDAPLSPARLAAADKVYILDLPIDRVFAIHMAYGKFAPELQKQIVEKVVWIDHHKTSIDTHPSEIPGFRIDGVAACRLAWQWFLTWKANGRGERGPWQEALPKKEDYVNRTVSEPLAVRLAGEYDIWDKRDGRTDVFQFGLRSRSLTKFDWDQMLSLEKPSIDEIEQAISVGFPMNLEPDGTAAPAVVVGLLAEGRLIQRYVDGRDAEICKACAYVVEFAGLKFLALNSNGRGSMQFAAKDVPETGHDALLKYNFDGRQWDVSLYHAKHRTDLDLSKIAVQYGGGGHRGACGFRADVILPFSNTMVVIRHK